VREKNLCIDILCGSLPYASTRLLHLRESRLRNLSHCRIVSYIFYPNRQRARSRAGISKTVLRSCYVGRPVRSPVGRMQMFDISQYYFRHLYQRESQHHNVYCWNAASPMQRQSISSSLRGPKEELSRFGDLYCQNRRAKKQKDEKAVKPFPPVAFSRQAKQEGKRKNRKFSRVIDVLRSLFAACLLACLFACLLAESNQKSPNPQRRFPSLPHRGVMTQSRPVSGVTFSA
jgi:hypothetical protein